MNIIDTHSHIYQSDFDNDIDEVIDRAKKVGLVNILLPNVDVESIGRINRLAKKYPNYCLPMMGLHPTSVTENWELDLKIIRDQFSKNNYIGVGEIGIDLYWDKSFAKQQKQVFEEQLRWSIEFDLPVVVHSRDAIAECIACIRNVGAENLRGVFHSFGSSLEDLKAILDLNSFYLGIGGVVTFKNSNLSDVLKETTLSHIIVETDSPYLTPVPFRGKRNESSYVQRVVDKLGEIYEVDPSFVAEVTTKNAQKLFSL